MTKHLYLIRHGETLFNVRKRIQGWCDSPLTENGIKQAKAARKCLEHIEFDHYYSSTAERSCDTLEIITDNKVEYKRLKQLKERNFGIFEGESEDLNPRFSKSFGYDDLFPHYGGETSSQVAQRMYDTLKDIMDKDDHYNVLAVSHGGACIGFLSHLCDPFTIIGKQGIPNCSIFHYGYNNEKFELIEILRPEVI